MANNPYFESLHSQALAAAQKAADDWLVNAQPKYEVRDSITGQSFGTMLDNCGNAHLYARKNTPLGRWARQRFRHDNSRGWILDLTGDYRRRQEHGLQLAACRAAQKVYKDAGYETGIWDYID